jgi:hypothetical protein
MMSKSLHEPRIAGRGVIALVVFTVLTVAAGVAPAVVRAGYFETDDLHDCVGHTEQDLIAAPEGTELPFGGVRVYRKDSQRGNSHAYCLTIEHDEGQGQQCCFDRVDIVLPPGLRRDAESLRFVAASSCLVRVDFHRRSTMERIFRRALDNFFNPDTRWKSKEIPERFDDRGYAMNSFLSCWGGET